MQMQTDKGLRQAHHTMPARQNIYVAGEPSDNVVVICEGWAARVMRLSDGRRQILSYLLPGDIVSTDSLFRDSHNYYVQSLTTVRYSKIKRSDVFERLKHGDALLELFGGMICSEKDEADELLADVGQRVAEERIARLILRLIRRLAARGLVSDRTVSFPLRQQHIADTVGLTAVHVSRIISALRKQEVVDISRGSLQVIDPARFLSLAGFRARDWNSLLAD